MAEIEPDLNKPPPHLEGYLLKQNSKAFIQMGRRAWKTYFFVIRKEKLLYFKKREDFHSQNDPISVIFLSRITEITECVHNAVPRKHHVNCGFQIISHDDTFNLLAETPRDAHHWVATLKYIKEYWSRMEVRNTVITAEQEKEFVRRALEDEEDELGALIGYYNEDVDCSIKTAKDTANRKDECSQMTVTIRESHQVTVEMTPTTTTQDLLESLKPHLTSSASLLWIISGQGDVHIFSHEEPIHYSSEQDNCQYYALDPSHVVLVVFFRDSEFKCIIAPMTITAQKVISHPTIATQRDKLGMSKCSLFFEGKEGETVFLPQECPCDILFAVNEHGLFEKANSGKLFIRNSTVGGGSTRLTATYRTRFNSIHPGMRHRGVRGAIQKQIIEDEEVQKKVLDKLANEKYVVLKKQEATETSDSSMKIYSDSDKKFPKRSPPIRQKRQVYGDFNSRTAHQLVSRKRASSTDPKPGDVIDLKKPSGQSLASLAATVAVDNSRTNTHQDTDVTSCEVDGEDLTSSENSQEPGLKLCVPLTVGDEEEEEKRLAFLFDGHESTHLSNKQDDADALVLSLAKKCHRIEAQLAFQEHQPLKPISFKLEMQESDSDFMDVCPNLKNVVSENPIPVYGIAFLKEVLKEESTDNPELGMDIHPYTKCGISLSGKTLMKDNGSWSLNEGSEFNRDMDILQNSNSVLSEELVLAGGIRALYDYSENQWFVLPPVETSKLGQNVVFSLLEESSDLIASKKALCQNVQSSVESILLEFQHARTAAGKEEIGNELTNPMIGHLIRFKLCPALVAIVNDGRKPYRYQGLIEVSLWEAVYQLNEGGCKVDVVYERARKHAQEVNVHPLIESPSMKFRTFMVLLLRDGLLAEWIEKLPLLQDTLKKDYIPKSFLRLSEPGGKTASVYRDVSIALDPLMKLPFAIDMMFEFKQQRSSADWPSIPSSPDLPSAYPGVQIDLPNEVYQEVPHLSGTQGNDDNQIGGKKTALKWFKKISSNLQELNRGGALTGRPKNYSQDEVAATEPSKQIVLETKFHHEVSDMPQFPHAPVLQENEDDSSNVQTASNENSTLMIALFNSTSERAEELNLCKGDIVAVEQKVDDEWLLCVSKNKQRGLVPLKYLQPLS